jgi:hypothetical protein
MKRRLVLPATGLLLVALLAYACNSGMPKAAALAPGRNVRSIVASTEAARRTGIRRVRFVNAMPGSPALELLQDSTSLFANVVFGAVSPFKQVRDDSPLLTLRGTQPHAEASLREELRDGGCYTVVALPDSLGHMSLRVIRDEPMPDAGMARIRLIHAAPHLEHIAVSMSGAHDPLFADVAFGMKTSFRDVAPGTAGFLVRSVSQGAPLVQVPRAILTAGTRYTFLLTVLPDGQVAMLSFSDASDVFPIVTRANR